jgi:hypothetical protein
MQFYILTLKIIFIYDRAVVNLVDNGNSILWQKGLKRSATSE